jgi:hypothetical protein
MSSGAQRKVEGDAVPEQTSIVLRTVQTIAPFQLDLRGRLGQDGALRAV